MRPRCAGWSSAGGVRRAGGAERCLGHRRLWNAMAGPVSAPAYD